MGSTATPGPYFVSTICGYRNRCIIYVDELKPLAFLSHPEHPNELNALLMASSWSLLKMLERVRVTCHLTEDTTLARDIDRLIAEATSSPAPPEEDEPLEEDVEERELVDPDDEDEDEEDHE